MTERMKEKWVPKVGDKVVVYYADQDRTQTNASKGTIKYMSSCGSVLQIELPNGRILTAHPKQCRRLVKRERKRIWLPKDPERLKRAVSASANVMQYMKTKPHKCELENHIEFVEVIKNGRELK